MATLRAAVSANNANTNSSISNKGQGVAQAFFEVMLKQPKVGADDWSQDMDCTDPWVFPLRVRAGASSLGSRTWYFMRPAGERGEVPDWKWLNDTYGGKYPEPGAVIKGK